MGLFYDSTYLLVILAALISMAVSARMNTIFSKYQTVRSYSGMTGREAAMRILHQAGIYDVTVRHVSGKLTDHYDPRTKTVNLSDAVYDSTSVAAIVPAANLGSQLFWPLFLIGLIFSLPMLVKAGIWLFVLALAFQVVTLPVEFDASRRALKMLSEGGMVTETEHDGVKKVLWAAAMTYVAAVIGSLLQLLRLLILSGAFRRNDD